MRHNLTDKQKPQGRGITNGGRMDIEGINNQVNAYQYIREAEGKNTWYSPKDFYANGGGDCEDFAIAKYMLLKDSGIPEDQLRIAHVKDGKDRAHMVVFYYPSEDSSPLVLDNLDKKIKPLEERKDLRPVYSFNSTHIFSGEGKLLGTTKNLKQWQQIINP